MQTHISRSQTRTRFRGMRYRLTAQIHVAPDELRLINHSRLARMEIFHDPLREDLSAEALAAHAKAKARGLFVTKARDATAIAASEVHALIATYRASNAFTVTLGDLIHGGVTIEHKSLQAITEIENAITESLDRVDAFVRAAGGYIDFSEDLFAPGADEEPTVPPAEWARTWRR